MKDTEIGDILSKGASSLDITPSMFKEATEHYIAVGKFLVSCGVEAEISPFGSIMTGTVVRPYSEDENAYFDIDVLVNRPDIDRTNNTPGEARNPVDKALLGSKRYGNMAKVFNECITIEYFANGIEGGFRLDLNTCVDDRANPRAQVCETYPKYASDAVALAWINPKEWHGSNPHGLCQWFIDRNERFAVAGRYQRKAKILEENRGVFASIEEVPDSLDRSEMQRAVQILKRFRDEFYHRSGNSDKAPGSCIVTVMVGNISEELPDNANVVDFLEEFTRYVRSLASTRALRNPVYDEDLLQNWEDGDFALLTLWTEEIRRSLDNMRRGTQAKCNAAVESIFGSKIGRKILPASATVISAPNIVVPSKPWAM